MQNENNEKVAALIRSALCQSCEQACDVRSGRPLIAVVNSWMSFSPGDVHLKELGERVMQSIRAAGGEPVEIIIPGFCGELKINSSVRHYYFAYRDFAAAMVEFLLAFHGFSGAAFLCTCDNQIPAFVMGALRVNIPSLFLTGGYMSPGVFDGKEITAFSVAKQYGKVLAGDMDEESLARMVRAACPTPGACPEMGTANTMAVLTEAMGLSVPGSSCVPANSPRQRVLAELTGPKLMHCVEEDIRPRAIVTEAALRNAIRVCLAIGGSTNAVIHTIAYARELGVDVDLAAWDALSDTTPFVCAISPNRPGHFMPDFDQAGGTLALMKVLEPLLETAVLRHDGRTLAQELSEVAVTCSDTLRPLDDPFSVDGGLVVLRGNLAPDGGVLKKSSISPDLLRFSGVARVFDCEEDAIARVTAGDVDRGDVLVIRYEGPRAGPGSREVVSILHVLAGRGLQNDVAVITDGRLSGTNLGLAICNISPEAYMGTALSVVEDGDRILIDIPAKRLELLLDEAALARRLSAWKQPAPKVCGGVLALYAKNVSQISEGARII